MPGVVPTDPRELPVVVEHEARGDLLAVRILVDLVERLLDPLAEGDEADAADPFLHVRVPRLLEEADADEEVDALTDEAVLDVEAELLARALAETELVDARRVHHTAAGLVERLGTERGRRRRFRTATRADLPDRRDVHALRAALALHHGVVTPLDAHDDEAARARVVRVEGDERAARVALGLDHRVLEEAAEAVLARPPLGDREVHCDAAKGLRRPARAGLEPDEGVVDDVGPEIRPILDPLPELLLGRVQVGAEALGVDAHGALHDLPASVRSRDDDSLSRFLMAHARPPGDPKHLVSHSHASIF